MPIVLAGVFLLLLLISLGLRHRDRLDELSDLLRRTEQSSHPAEIASPVAPPRDADEGDDAGLRLQILNATGVDRLALDTSDRLRRWGVDTLDRGNAPAWPFPETLLLVRTERSSRLAEVKKLAASLGGVPVLRQNREDLVLDATLLLGHDWEDYQWPDP